PDLVGHADAGVLYTEQHVLAIRIRRGDDADRPTRGDRIHRIREEGEQRLAKLRRVRFDPPRRIRPGHDRDGAAATTLELRPDTLDHVSHRIAEADRDPVPGSRAAARDPLETAHRRLALPGRLQD